MRYKEIRNYIGSIQPCPELTHYKDVHIYDHSGYIQILDAAYRTYLDINLVKGQKEFSTKICGKAPSYLSCMRARGRTPSLLVLDRILNDARLLRDGIRANKHFGSPHAPTLNSAQNALEALVNTMEQVMGEQDDDIKI